MVKGYKVFKPDWTCRGKQYTCPGKFEENITPVIYERGMHFCKKAVECFNYYDFNPVFKVAEVIAYGTVEEKGDKCCTDKLEIVREIPWAEVLELVNTGIRNTGIGNSGNYNSGNYNSGDRNTGNNNSGDFNSCNCSNGCFNTETPKMYFFNQPSDWTPQDWHGSDAYWILDKMPAPCVHVQLEDMTEEEKAVHPKAEITDGYLKKLESAELAQKRQAWWETLSKGEKDTVRSLPNFNAAIFKEITGIELVEKEK